MLHVCPQGMSLTIEKIEDSLEECERMGRAARSIISHNAAHTVGACACNVQVGGDLISLAAHTYNAPCHYDTDTSRPLGEQSLPGCQLQPLQENRCKSVAYLPRIATIRTGLDWNGRNSELRAGMEWDARGVHRSVSNELDDLGIQNSTKLYAIH